MVTLVSEGNCLSRVIQVTVFFFFPEAGWGGWVERRMAADSDGDKYSLGLLFHPLGIQIQVRCPTPSLLLLSSPSPPPPSPFLPSILPYWTFFYHHSAHY